MKNFCELCAFSRNGLDADIGYTSGEFRGKDGWLKGPVEAGISKGWSAFPNDDSVYRLIYLGLEQISRKWTMPIKNWKAALQQFAILYEDRLPLEALGVTKA